MKKVFALFLITMLFLSCSNDDTNSQQEEQSTAVPSEFVISVEPSFASAVLEWTVGEGINNENLQYSIFLNNELVAQELSTRNYIIGDLEFSTPYALKITAQNSNGNKSIETNFQTLNPENYRIQVDSIYYFAGTLDLSMIYEYDSIDKTYFVYTRDGGGLDGDNKMYYDEMGRLIRQKVSEYLYSEDINIAYDNDGNIIDLYIDGFNEFSFTNFNYSFSSFNSSDYNVVYTAKDYFTGDIVEERSYSVNLELDEADRVIYYRRLNLETQEEDIIQFEYNNDNLTKIIEVTNNNLMREYVYDNKNSYLPHDLISYRTSSSFAPFYYMSGYVRGHSLFMPKLALFKNKNNFKSYKENGEVIEEYFYQYNDVDYPLNYRYDNDNRGADFNYIIEER